MFDVRFLNNHDSCKIYFKNLVSYKSVQVESNLPKNNLQILLRKSSSKVSGIRISSRFTGEGMIGKFTANTCFNSISKCRLGLLPANRFCTRQNIKQKIIIISQFVTRVGSRQVLKNRSSASMRLQMLER